MYEWWFSIVLTPLLAFHLWRSGLNRKYPFFFASMLISTVCQSVLAAVAWAPRNLALSFDIDHPYFWVWTVLSPVSHLMSFLIVLELYSLVFGNYKGIATASRWALFTALGISLAISLLILPLELRNQASAVSLRGTILRFMSILDRGVTASLVVFLLLIALYLFWCPVPLCRNLILHCIVFSSLFFSRAVLLLVHNINGNVPMAIINLLQEGAWILCQFVWIFWFTPQGEMRQARIRGPAPPAREAALVEQLDSLNVALLRAGRLRNK